MILRTIARSTAAFAFLLGMMLITSVSAAAESACTCRYDGRSLVEGTCICIITSSGPRTACCNKVLNNTAWVFTRNDCAIASVPERSVPQTRVNGDTAQSRPSHTPLQTSMNADPVPGY